MIWYRRLRHHLCATERVRGLGRDRQIANIPWVAILWGIALAATAGLRLFMPFLFVGVMRRCANVPTPEMLDWTTTDAGMHLLLDATVLEVLGDKIPDVDHVLDASSPIARRM